MLKDIVMTMKSWNNYENIVLFADLFKSVLMFTVDNIFNCLRLFGLCYQGNY